MLRLANEFAERIHLLQQSTLSSDAVKDYLTQLHQSLTDGNTQLRD